MSDCQRVQSRLVAFLLGEVSERESTWLAEHVRICPVCQEELASLNLTVEILRRLPREDVSAGFERKLALRLAEHAPRQRAGSGRRPRWPWPAAVAAAVVLAALIPFLARSPVPKPQPLPATRQPQRRDRVAPVPAPPAPVRADASSKPTGGGAKGRAVPSAPVLAEEAVARPATPPVVGRVLRVTGTPRVVLRAGRRSASMRAGMVIPAGAVLTTGDSGQAEVELPGGSRVRIDFDTSVAFAAGRASARKPRGEVRLSSGRLWLLVPRSQRGLVVRTPQARMEALGPISAVSVVAADRLHARGPGLHVELAALTTATAMRGRLRLASDYGSVTAEEGASAAAAAVGTPFQVPGMAHLASVRAQAPWGQTFFEVWVADRLELDEALRWVTADDGDDALLAANRLLAAGRTAEASRAYEALLGARPDDAAACSDLGLARELRGDTEGALAAYQRATTLAPRSAYYLHNLGMAYLRIGNLWRACDQLAAALALDPELPGARFELGRAQSVMGDYDGATRQAELLEASPDTAAQGACLRGDVCWLQGDMAGAEQSYLKAVQDDPSSVNPMTYLAGLRLLDGRLDEAYSWAERALAVDPDSLRALNRLGLVLLAEGRPAEAEAALLQAEKAHPGSGIVFHNLGAAYLQQGDTAAAVAARRQAVAVAPDSVLCHVGLAIALEANGDTNEACDEYEATLRLDPTYEEAAQRLAALLKRLGDPAAAQLVLTQLHQYLP